MPNLLFTHGIPPDFRGGVQSLTSLHSLTHTCKHIQDYTYRYTNVHTTTYQCTHTNAYVHPYIPVYVCIHKYTNTCVLSSHLFWTSGVWTYQSGSHRRKVTYIPGLYVYSSIYINILYIHTYTYRYKHTSINIDLHTYTCIPGRTSGAARALIWTTSRVPSVIVLVPGDPPQLVRRAVHPNGCSFCFNNGKGKGVIQACSGGKGMRAGSSWSPQQKLRPLMQRRPRGTRASQKIGVRKPCCCCCVLHINRSGPLNHTQQYTWLPIRYVVCWTEKISEEHLKNSNHATACSMQHNHITSHQTAVATMHQDTRNAIITLGTPSLPPRTQKRLDYTQHYCRILLLIIQEGALNYRILCSNHYSPPFDIYTPHYP